MSNHIDYNTMPFSELAERLEQAKGTNPELSAAFLKRMEVEGNHIKGDDPYWFEKLKASVEAMMRNHH